MSAVAALALAMPGRAATVVIDSFSGGADVHLTTDTDDGLPTSIDQAGVSGVIGSGDRDLSITQVAPAASTSSSDIELVIEPSSESTAFLESGTGRTGTWTFDYGADTSFDVDVTNGGTNNAFIIDFIGTSALSGDTITLTAYDTFGASDFLIMDIPNAAGDLAFLFSDFTLDLTHIKRLTYFVQGAESGDYQINLLTAENTIPAPAALPAGLVLLAGAALLRRRRLV